MAKKENNPAPAEVATPEPVQNEHPEFQDGGRFYVKGLSYRDAIYVDNDGREYPAKISPIPTNKGTLAQIPAISDPQKAFAEIAVLPLEKQIPAVAELQEKLKSADKALLLDGQLIRLSEYKGVLMYTTERQVGDGKNAKIQRSPAANLLVNFGAAGKTDRWIGMQAVRPVEHVPGAAKGEATIPHFKLA